MIFTSNGYTVILSFCYWIIFFLCFQLKFLLVLNFLSHGLGFIPQSISVFSFRHILLIIISGVFTYFVMDHTLHCLCYSLPSLLGWVSYNSVNVYILSCYFSSLAYSVDIYIGLHHPTSWRLQQVVTFLYFVFSGFCIVGGLSMYDYILHFCRLIGIFLHILFVSVLVLYCLAFVSVWKDRCVRLYHLQFQVGFFFYNFFTFFVYILFSLVYFLASKHHSFAYLCHKDYLCDMFI